MTFEGRGTMLAGRESGGEDGTGRRLSARESKKYGSGRGKGPRQTVGQSKDGQSIRWTFSRAREQMAG